jgi:hypothetical protein
VTLRQMTILKRWLVLHQYGHAVEYFCWDAMLTTWVLGWVGLPAALILRPLVSLACLAAVLAPEAYVSLRVRLHKSGRLRCDWLGVLAQTRGR